MSKNPQSTKYKGTKTRESLTAELIRQIDTTLALTKGERIDVCYALYKVITQAEAKDQSALLQHTAEVFGEAESSEEIEIDGFIPVNERKQMEQRLGKMTNAMLVHLVQENLPEDTFYTRLWELINNPVFRDEKAKAFALYYVLIDRQIPYFQLPEGLKMANEDYRDSRRRLRRSCQRIGFILARDFGQRTEEADILLREIKSAKEADQVVLMVEVLSHFRADMELREKLRDLSPDLT
jgi:hypothetical protein